MSMHDTPTRGSWHPNTLDRARLAKAQVKLTVQRTEGQRLDGDALRAAIITATGDNIPSAQPRDFQEAEADVISSYLIGWVQRKTAH